MAFDFWTWYWAFVSFVFGATVGSFLNVCIWRIPRGESLAHPPSHCPTCDHRLLLWPDMVPLASQVWYRSKCRYCATPFSWRYFWVELFTAVMFVAAYFRYGVFVPAEADETTRIISTLLAMLFIAAMIVVFFIDLEHFSIADSTVIWALVAGLGRDGWLIYKGYHSLWQHVPGLPSDWMLPIPASILLGVIAFWGLWQLAALASAILGREAMGGGDALLLGAMGAFLLPWPLLITAFFLAVALGAFGGITGQWLYARAERAKSDAMPAGERTPKARVETEEGLPGERAETVAAHRGMAEAGEPDDSEAVNVVPELPPASRWGRLLTVAGTWAAVAAIWGGAALAAGSVATGIGFGAVAMLVAAGLLWRGVPMWLRGDKEWLPAMDQLFEEGDPGPRFIPFGPYLVAGSFLAMLVGPALVRWYATAVMGMQFDLSSWW